jgi:hypothetical protein
MIRTRIVTIRAPIPITSTVSRIDWAVLTDPLQAACSSA